MRLPNGFTAIKDAKGNNDIVSLLGVVVSWKDPRPSRGTDWSLEFEIQDDFTTGLVGNQSSIKCRMFRARDKLPKISGTGDVVILRRFKLSVWNGRVDCISDSKSYSGVLVFPANKIPVPELSQAYQLGSQRLPCDAVRGTDDATTAEQMAVIHLKHAASASIQQVQQHAATVSFKATTRDKISLIKDLDFSRFYDVRVQVLNSYYYNGGELELKVTDYTSNTALFCYIDPAEETHYMAAKRDWTGPYGQLTLSVMLYGNNAVWARDNVAVGDFVFLRNMRTKLSRANYLEGALHEDRDDRNKVDIRKLISQSDIAEINKRREAYELQRVITPALPTMKDPPKGPAAQKGSKKAEKRRRAREQKEAEQKELENKEKQWMAERSGINVNGKCFCQCLCSRLRSIVRAAFVEMKLSTISEIVYTRHLKTRSTEQRTEFTLPFVNARHRCRVRVVDVWPPEIELFAHSNRDTGWVGASTAHDAPKKERWEWGFVLLLEDANVPPNTVSEKLRVTVDNNVGQGLLNQHALE